MFLDWCAARGLVPEQATPDVIVDYRQSLRDCAPATVALKLQVVRTLYAALGVEPNPADGVQAPPDRTPREERVEYLTPAEVGRVFAAVDQAESPLKRARDRAMLRMLVTFGLRAAEVRGLRLCDVVFLEESPGRMYVMGKGAKRRTLYLTEETARALLEWLELRPGDDDEASPLFVGLTGRGGLSDPGLRKIVNGWLVEAGVKRDGISCHVFRHTALTLAAKAGALRDQIQRMAGHADARTTDLYIHIAEAERENPARLVEGVLGG